MRKIPKPSSLGLTPLYCEDHFAQAARGGRHWFEVNWREGIAYSNGHVLINRLPKFKGYDYSETGKHWHVIGRPHRAARYDADILRKKDPENGYLLEIGEDMEVDTKYHPYGLTALNLPASGSRFTQVQTHYLELINWMYPDATLYSFYKNEVISVVENGEVVGLVLPCRR